MEKEGPRLCGVLRPSAWRKRHEITRPSTKATPTFGGLGLADDMTAGSQFIVQIIGLLAVGVWTAILTYIIIKAVGLVADLRVGEEVEIEGLDITVHGERAYAGSVPER